jgi:hypothetical protein
MAVISDEGRGKRAYKNESKNAWSSLSLGESLFSKKNIHCYEISQVLRDKKG